jgi:hypothetical protein
VPTPRAENTQHGDANARAQLHKTSIRKDFRTNIESLPRIFGRMFLRVRWLQRGATFSNFFDPARVELSALTRAQQPKWSGIFFEHPCSQLKNP